MTKFIFRLWQFFNFYIAAITKYQLHSPFVFELAKTVLEDNRWYYAFRDVERIRRKMLENNLVLQVQDYGVRKDRQESLRKLASRASSSPRQGQRLFRLANWANPGTMIELGTSVGIGAMYLISGARTARFLTLEGSPQIAGVARENLDILGFGNKVAVVEGAFEKTLKPSLESLQSIDFVYFDGNHRQTPTLAYFETCLSYATEKTVFVFDDAHWSPEMAAAWRKVQQHPRVTLTVDFFDLSLAFISPDFKQKQHLKIIPASWKIWRFL